MKAMLIAICAVMLAMALLLTMAPACGKGEEPGPGYTPTPGVTPTPEVTPTPTPAVKMLKMGVLLPFSGPGAVWGIDISRGAEWAADRVNAAGGFKVGADTYMIELVKCDTKLIGSVGANCAASFVYDEQIHYVIGPIGVVSAVSPILTEGKCFSAMITNAQPLYITPDFPYNIATAAPVEQWVDTFWRQAYQAHPEIKTVAIVSSTSATGDLYVDAGKVVHPRYGGEVIHVQRYEQFTSDYYPTLTLVVAKNPDVIDFAGGVKGDIDLMVKQVRELGYTGLLAGGAHGEAQSTIDVAGLEYAEGFMFNSPDYSCDLYPEKTHQLIAEVQQLYPGAPLGLGTYLASGSVMLYIQAMEKAGSIDPDEVSKVLDDPDWEFELFGMPGASLGGLETFGIRRALQDEVGYTEIINGKFVQKSRGPVVVP